MTEDLVPTMEQEVEQESWRDHAPVCPRCREHVIKDDAHFARATTLDPGYWQCR